MPTTYERAKSDVIRMMDTIRRTSHPDLEKAEVTIDVLMANNQDGDSVTLGGYPCQAKVKIVGLKDRAKGCKDAEIIIDELNWNSLSEAEQRALLDHELHHLIVQFDGQLVKEDDLGRPKLKMRKHDWQIGWFDVIAQRHGEASPEVRQAHKVWQRAGQLYFGFARDFAATE